MAKIFVDQGNLEKAIEIYRYLLERDPARGDIADKLFRLAAANTKSLDRTVVLIREWIDLVLKYNNLQKLKRLRESS